MKRDEFIRPLTEKDEIILLILQDIHTSTFANKLSDEGRYYHWDTVHEMIKTAIEWYLERSDYKIDDLRMDELWQEDLSYSISEVHRIRFIAGIKAALKELNNKQDES